MELERNPVLWDFTKQPNNKFEKYYSQLDELKIAIEQNHSELANRKGPHRASSGQCSASCVFNYSTRTAAAWLGCITPPTLLVYNLYIIINNITHRILFSDNMGTMFITKEFDRPNSLVTPNNK